MHHRAIATLILTCLLTAGLQPLGAQRIISTLAGKDFVYPRTPQAPLAAPLGPVADVAWGADGQLYIADPRNRLVFEQAPSGRVSIFAGNAFNIFSGDGGRAVDAGLRRPVGLAVGPDDAVYISDQDDNRIRRVLPDGTMETFAGNGVARSAGDGLLASRASIHAPAQMAFDRMGNLYVAEYGGDRIRRIDSSGFISTAADAIEPMAVTVDGDGLVWFGDARGLSRFTPGMRDSVESIGPGLTIAGLTVDPMGVVAWSTGDRHQVFSLRGSSGVIVGNGSAGLVVGNGFPGASGDGGPAAEGRVTNPLGLDYAPDGRLAVADSGNGLVRQVDADGILSRLAGSRSFRFSGDGGPAPLATLNSPQGVAVTQAGEALIADTNSNRIRAVDADGRIRSLESGSPEGDALNPMGLFGPTDVVEGPLGELFVADRGNLRVARLTDGIPETVAGGGFVRNSDGLPATEARLFDPTDIAFDMAGNLLISDRADHRVRGVTPGGIIGGFAGTGLQGGSGDQGLAQRAALNHPSSVAAGPGGEIYIADEGNHRVRVVTPDGRIRNVAGGGGAGFAGDGQHADSAKLSSPSGVAVGADGSLYIADTGNHRIRRVGLDQVIETVAGNGQADFSGDGGPATAAALNRPAAVAVDPRGNLLIADESNDRVRLVLADLPVFDVSAVASPGEPTDLLVLDTVVGEDSPARSISLNPELAGLQFEVRLIEDGVVRTSLDWLEVSPLQGAMPATLRIVGKGLSAGQFNGQVAVRILGATDSDFVNLDVTLNVDEPPLVPCTNDCTSPFTSIEFERTSLVFGTYQGSVAETAVLEPELVLLQPPPAISLSPPQAGQSTEFDLFARAIADDGGAWLSVFPSSTMTVDRKVPPIEVVANPLNLPVGTYTGRIEVGGDGIPVKTLPVAMTIAPSKPKLELDRTGLTFRAVSGGPRPLERSFVVRNAGTGRMAWTASTETLEGGPWLSVSSRSGEVIGEIEDSSLVDVSVNPAGLAPGDYFGRIEISAEGTTPQSVTVIFNVRPASEALPPDVSVNGLVFTAAAGRTPGSQDVTFANLNATEVSYAAFVQGPDGSKRILHAPSIGLLAPGERETIRVQPDFEQTAGGVSRERLSIGFSVGGSSDIDITTVKVGGGFALTEENRPAGGGCERQNLVVTPTSGAIVQHPQGQPLALGAIVVDNCGEPFTGGGLVKFSVPGAEIDLQHQSEGNWTGSYQPRAAAGSIVASYTAILGFQIAQEDVTIEIIEGATVPLIGEGGLVNAASFEQAPQISPGSLISLFGEELALGSNAATTAPLPEELSGARVTLGDRQLKLFFAGNNQINAQIPFDIEPNLQHRIEIRRGSAASVPEQVTVAPTQPGIFAVNQAGSGQAVIVDAQTFVISDSNAPAARGDALSAFATGLGAVDPPAPEGERAPFSPLSRTVNPVTVTVGGESAQLLFAGLAPGFAGLYQVNFVVPGSVAPGAAVPVTLTVDGKTSPPVTIAVE